MNKYNKISITKVFRGGGIQWYKNVFFTPQRGLKIGIWDNTNKLVKEFVIKGKTILEQNE